MPPLRGTDLANSLAVGLGIIPKQELDREPWVTRKKPMSPTTRTKENGGRGAAERGGRKRGVLLSFLLPRRVKETKQGHRTPAIGARW
jgi:hypothetical protein